ncbi:MAG: hypothetical protein ABIF85_03030 [Nanoarchaeota archaeon]|nr:hypothetical protein [Nanoarchaeota archaeon]MBU4300893.1 hypothetical protein [Nanoarchaeota archaeon]MBU4451312.1 hypothetical protein [Nanoarchaeota archaeon]MCG2723652.1 hypothetical protein [archaeon]
MKILGIFKPFNALSSRLITKLSAIESKGAQGFGRDGKSRYMTAIHQSLKRRERTKKRDKEINKNLEELVLTYE